MEPKIPLSAVLRLLDNQNAFHTQLIDKLGLYLSQAATSYERALNPPVNQGNDVEMSYSRLDETAEDLQYQIDTGMITPDQITDQMRRILGDTDIAIDIT